MARGDIHWFNRPALDGFKKVYDLSADTLKLGIITSANAPVLNTPNPCWGNGGTTDFSLDQVVSNGAGYTGPVTLAAKTFTQVANVATLAANSVNIPQDVASGFTNGAYGIFYDDSAAAKQAFGYLDLGGPVGNANGPLLLNFNASAVSGPIFIANAT